jgi:hypothetical protein
LRASLGAVFAVMGQPLQVLAWRNQRTVRDGLTL